MIKIIGMRILTAWAVGYLVAAFIKMDAGWIFGIADWSAFDRFFFLSALISVAYPVVCVPKDSRDWLFRNV